MRSRFSTVELVVEAVIEALKRIPDSLRKLSFFGWGDAWYYIAIGENTCAVCWGHDGKEFEGAVLRGLFPWLEVIGPNTIRPRVHPNCRCILIRRDWMEGAMDNPLGVETRHEHC